MDRPGGPWYGPGRRPLAIPTDPTITIISPNTGRLAGGTAVTITGHNFRNTGAGSAPTVTFGGLPATSVVVVNSTTITCNTPAQTDTGAVDVVITIDSQSGTLHNGFTYITSAVISLSPAYGPLSGGTDVMIFGYNFVSGSTVTFGGNAATNVIFIDNQHIRVTTPNHAVGFVDVVVSEPLGGDVATKRGGFQYTLLTRGDDIRRMPGIVIRDVLNNAPNSCDFTVDGDSNIPTLGEKIEIIDDFDSNRQLFAGTVVSVTQVYEGQTDQLAWMVKCVDFTWLFNRKRPFGSFVGVSASDVVVSLVQSYAPEFTTTHVQTRLAKVTMTLDGSKDMNTVMSEIAAAIGGGHWYVDYNMDVHFFHVVPAGFQLPPTGNSSSGSSIPLTAPMTVAQSGTAIGFNYPPGYYYFRQSFIYDDGSESGLGPISNVVELDGHHGLSFTSVQTGANIGSLTCTGTRIWMIQLVGTKDSGSLSFEDYKPFVQINDVVTTSFTTDFKEQGISVATGVAIPDGTAVPAASSSGHPNGPTTAPSFSTYSGRNNEFPAGIPSGRSSRYQTRVAFLYRDGSVSYTGPASSSSAAGPGGTNQGPDNEFMIVGYTVIGYKLYGVPVGPTIATNNDVVARLLYFSAGYPEDPNFSANSNENPELYKLGAQWPNKNLDPTWDIPYGIMVVPNNTDTGVLVGSTYDYPNLLLFDIADYNYSASVIDLIGGTVPVIGKLVSKASPETIFLNPSEQQSLVFSPDPIPMWPNPDGPDLESNDLPDDIDDANEDLLYESAGQPITWSADMSQVRNRIYVIGSGANTTATAAVGATQLEITDVGSFALGGGQVRIENPGTRKSLVLKYRGVGGVVGKQLLFLNNPLPEQVPQGALVANFLQYDNVESQKRLGQAELDKDGNPTDGIHEYTIVDTSLKAAWQLYMRAFAELELFADPIITVSYSTRDPKSRSGKLVHVDLTNPPIEGDFLIQEVTIDQIRDEGDQLAPRYTVKASSVRYELNDLLLKILTETSGALGPSSSGGGSASQAATAVGSLTTVQASDDNDQTLRYWGSVRHTDDTSGTGFVYIGLTSMLQTNSTASSIDDIRRNWVRQNQTADGNAASLNSQNNPGFLAPDWSPVCRWRFRTGPSINGWRFFLGLTAQSGGNTSIPNNTDSNWANLAVSTDKRAAIALRFSKPLGDTGFKIAISDGLGTAGSPTGYYQEYANRLGPLEINTEYLFELNVNATARTATFTLIKVADSSGTVVNQSYTYVVPLPAILFNNGIAESVNPGNGQVAPMYWCYNVYKNGTNVAIDMGGGHFTWGNQ